MKDLVNENVIAMLNNGLLNYNRINNLIYIKEFIDRISTIDYLKANDLNTLNSKFGVLPSIVTWGDYFQAEMASSLVNLSDMAFTNAIETVKFDMISSYNIFSEQDDEFFDWVDDNYSDIVSEEKTEYTQDESDILHLKILKDYYIGLGIENRFTQAEIEWYTTFKEAMAI